MDVSVAITFLVLTALAVGWTAGAIGKADLRHQIKQLRRFCAVQHVELTKLKQGEWWQRGEPAPEYEE